MISDAGPDSGRMAGSGRERPAKPGQSIFTVLPKQHSSSSGASSPPDHKDVVVQSQGSIAARSSYSGLPAIGAAPAGPDALTQLLNRMQHQVQGTLSDQVTPLRLAGHLSVLLIAAVILILSQVKIPEWELSLQPAPQPTAGSTFSQGAVAQNQSGLFDNATIQRRPVFSIIDTQAKPVAPRQDITYYSVKSGDTVLAIAQKYGLQPETLMWSNSIIEQNPDRLSIGDELRILPVDGVLHVVKPGETLSDLADEYGVEMQEIVAYTSNSLSNTADTLTVGRELVVPGGTRAFATASAAEEYGGGAYYVDAPDNGPQGSGNFSWPSAGYVSQGYWGGHPAIDIAGSVGAPVNASDGGYVVLAGGGWNGGYGNHVIIDHGNGFTTLYAHMNSIFVSPGMTVSKGQQLGTMGNTGNSTGPHLHMEVRYGGVPYNPANYLD